MKRQVQVIAGFAVALAGAAIVLFSGQGSAVSIIAVQPVLTPHWRDAECLISRESSDGSGEWLIGGETFDENTSRVRLYRDTNKFPSGWAGSLPVMCWDAATRGMRAVEREAWAQSDTGISELGWCAGARDASKEFLVSSDGGAKLRGKPLLLGGVHVVGTSVLRSSSGDVFLAVLSAADRSTPRLEYHFGGGASQLRAPFYLDVFYYDTGVRVGVRVRLDGTQASGESLQLGWLTDSGVIVVQERWEGVRAIWCIDRAVWEPKKGSAT